jgi:excisionase family DNA binding protein
MVTTGEAAQIKGVTRQAVHAAIVSGKLKAVQSGKFWLIRRKDLEKWEIHGHRPRKTTEG